MTREATGTAVGVAVDAAVQGIGDFGAVFVTLRATHGQHVATAGDDAAGDVGVAFGAAHVGVHAARDRVAGFVRRQARRRKRRRQMALATVDEAAVVDRVVEARVAAAA